MIHQHEAKTLKRQVLDTPGPQFGQMKDLVLYFSYSGAASPGPQHDIPSSMVSQTRNRRTGVQPNEAAKQRFTLYAFDCTIQRILNELLLTQSNYES